MPKPPVTYQGAPCIHGHDGTRYSATKRCVTCALQTQARLYDTSAQTARKRAYRARVAQSKGNTHAES